MLTPAVSSEKPAPDPTLFAPSTTPPESPLKARIVLWLVEVDVVVIVTGTDPEPVIANEPPNPVIPPVPAVMVSVLPGATLTNPPLAGLGPIEPVPVAESVRLPLAPSVSDSLAPPIVMAALLVCTEAVPVPAFKLMVVERPPISDWNVTPLPLAGVTFMLPPPVVAKATVPPPWPLTVKLPDGDVKLIALPALEFVMVKFCPRSIVPADISRVPLLPGAKLVP